MTGRRRFTVPSEALCDLEQRLQKPLFLGAPLGSTLNDVLIVELLLGNREWDLGSVCSDVLHWGYHAMKGIGTRRQVALDPHRCLVTWCEERVHRRDLVLPVITALGPSQCTVIGASAGMGRQLPAETQFLTFADTPRLDSSIWWPAYRANVGPWARRLVRAFDEYGIPRRVLPRLMDWLLIESQMLVSFGALLEYLRPSAVLTEGDRYHTAAPLILAARLRRIPTLTMVHGAIDARSCYGWTPLLADYVLCWGQSQAELFAQRGVSPERIVITGRQSTTREIGADRELARGKVGLSSDLPLVLLATNPINPAWRHDLVRAFCEGMARLPDIVAAVRLHPSEHVDFYRSEMAEYPQVRFLENAAWTLDEAMAACDIVAVHSSTFAMDALTKHRPVIVIDALPDPMYGQELAEQAGCPNARDPGEVVAIVHRLLEDPAYRGRCHDQAERYVARYSAHFGDDAAHRVAAAVQRAIEVIP